MIKKALYILDRPLLAIPLAIIIGGAAAAIDYQIDLIVQEIQWVQWSNK